MITGRKLLFDIARVGSIDYQRRWSVNGTPDEYLLLDEYVEVTIHAVKNKVTHSLLSRKLSEGEKITLLEFHDRVNKLYDDVPWNDPAISIEEIVENNEAMKQIRQAANDCLKKLGVEYSVEELLQDQ